jgi:hypothetical protein
MTIDYPANVTAATHPTAFSALTGTIATDSVRLRAPGAIPKDQLFFWTRRWQEGEAESTAARERGDVREFSTGRDAVRWLLDDE